MGLKVNLCSLRLFGSFGSILVKNKLVTAKESPGDPCIFIGYGEDTQSYRIIMLKVGAIAYRFEKDVVIRSSRNLTRAFVRGCRNDPVYQSLVP